MSTPTPPKKLLDQVRDLIRLKYYSIHTEEAYTDWIKRYILFHGKRHPQEMGRPVQPGSRIYHCLEKKLSLE